MTNEEKQLLIKDLCARLPYEVIASINGENATIYGIDENTIIASLDGRDYKEEFIISIGNDTDTIKPYLRPMSSITEEEYKELKSISPYYGFAPYEYIGDWCPNYDMVDWLNAHHFDYRGLIEKGLALEAPEDMYKTK